MARFIVKPLPLNVENDLVSLSTTLRPGEHEPRAAPEAHRCGEEDQIPGGPDGVGPR